MASNSVYISYSSGARGKHKRPLSPYTGAEMGRDLSNGSYSSRWSTAAVASSASGSGRHSPESPGGGITASLNSFDFNSNNEQQHHHHHHHQQAHDPQYAEPASSPYQFQYSYPSASSPTGVTFGSQSQDGCSWVQFYDFIAQVEQGQTPYWQLKKQFTPSKDYPKMRPVVQESDATPRSEHLNTCLAPMCDSKPFKRKADLERHYQQVHVDSAVKMSYPCDYQRCPRLADPFYRRDHCRDHYREYHKEDMMRRSSSSAAKKETPEWWADRGVSKKWWRCSKCLRRVFIQQDRFECRDCKSTCEAERRRFRGYS